MAKQAKLSGEDEAYAEAEKVLGPVKYGAGGAVGRSGHGMAAPVQLPADQEREAQRLGQQDAQRELERRGLKPPPVVESTLSANFDEIKKPLGPDFKTEAELAQLRAQAAQGSPPSVVAPASAGSHSPAEASSTTPEAIVVPPTDATKATIRTAGYDPRTGQVVDPQRYAAWRARHNVPTEHKSPEVRSESGWFELRAKLPKPLPSPVMKLQGADAEEAKKAYCGLMGMAYPNPSTEWELKPCAAPEGVPA